MIQTLLTACLLLATPVDAAVYPALSYEQAMQLPPQDREDYFDILQNYYTERERHETATGWGFLLELVAPAAVASGRARECTEPIFDHKKSQWSFQCKYTNQRGRNEWKEYWTLGEDNKDFYKQVKRYSHNPNSTNLPSPVYEQDVTKPKPTNEQFKSSSGAVRDVGKGKVHQVTLSPLQNEKSAYETNKWLAEQQENERAKLRLASSSEKNNEEPVPTLASAPAPAVTPSKDNTNPVHPRERGATDARRAAGKAAPKLQEPSSNQNLNNEDFDDRLSQAEFAGVEQPTSSSPNPAPAKVDPYPPLAELKGEGPALPVKKEDMPPLPELTGGGPALPDPKPTSPATAPASVEPKAREAASTPPSDERDARISSSGSQQRNGASRDRRMAAADALDDAHGDCVNAGFNFLRPKGGRRGYCRGISSICGASKEQSVQSVPPMREYEKLFCEGNDRSAGRCDEKSDDIFNLNVVCDPMTFGVAQTNSGAPKVICVARGRNNSQKCKERAAAVGAKFLCPSTEFRGPATNPSTASTKPGELATQATAHKKDCVPAKGNSTRLYNQKILAMARDCGWGKDPLTQKGTAAHKNRSAKAKKDISEACRHVEPKLVAFRESLASRTDVKHILEEIGKKPTETLPGPAPARPSTLPPPPAARPSVRGVE